MIPIFGEEGKQIVNDFFWIFNFHYQSSLLNRIFILLHLEFFVFFPKKILDFIKNHPHKIPDSHGYEYKNCKHKCKFKVFHYIPLCNRLNICILYHIFTQFANWQFVNFLFFLTHYLITIFN